MRTFEDMPFDIKSWTPISFAQPENGIPEYYRLEVFCTALLLIHPRADAKLDDHPGEALSQAEWSTLAYRPQIGLYRHFRMILMLSHIWVESHK